MASPRSKIKAKYRRRRVFIEQGHCKCDDCGWSDRHPSGKKRKRLEVLNLEQISSHDVDTERQNDVR